MRALTIPSLLLVAAAACGGPQQRSGGDYESIPLGQARAVELYEETITSSGYGSVTRNTEAQLTNGTGVNVDVLVPSLAAGFVYLNEQDRRDLEGELPEPSSASELYALLATQLPGEEQIHVLIVQDEDFEYIPNPRGDERLPQHRTLSDVEARLRRDARDYLEAVADLRGERPEG